MTTFASVQGNYTVVDREIDSSVPSFPIVRYGTYRARIRAGKAGIEKTYVCFHSEIDILQKPSL